MALVTINRSPLGSAGEFMSVSKATLFYVLRELSPAEQRLFLFLVANKNGYTFPFSKQYIENEIGLSKNSFYRARDGLIAKGHLTLIDADHYQFNETKT